MKTIKGRYRIEEKLGEGGMGVVFRAYDPPPMDREVAVKTLHEFADPVALDLFYKECSVLKAISHPNIVEIFDIGVYEEEAAVKPFFVMPLLRGQTLDALIKNASHRLTVDRVVQIITQTCRGLQAAHEHGLVHRDLKPSNLFVIADDSVKIIDFGVAHVLDSRSQTVGMKGTLLYMAPEQLQNKPVSPQSDIFSLGVVCYEALTRRLPFRGGTQDQIIQAVQTHIPPPASEINPAVSQAISRAVHKAMAKQPWNRYDSAKEFGETLQKALHNLPIEIFDPSRIQPRIDRAAKALETGDYQFAGEIIGELEASGHIDQQIGHLRTELDQVVRRRTIAQLLESARARFEEDEDPLALQKLQEILEVDPGNVQALSLKSKIDARRSERQIEKWMRLAEEHVKNHSYAHAREALQNVLMLRPKESRALQLVKDLEAEEQEYIHLRNEKGQIYKSALNAWKNGDISEALSNMRLVLELEGRAPDNSSPETGASYQSFFNKVQSEHDAINNGYAEARRRLAGGDSSRALEICLEFLEKYPGQALFQALKFDVEEQRRQQLSAFIADVNRRLEAESDLNAKVSLLSEAVQAYPDEPHFERSLKVTMDKRDLVHSIVLRAQVHEERGQINEAISDFETLKSIYPSYQGLKFEIERLQRRREQQSRDAAKANWVRQIDRARETGNFARVVELVERAQADFPEDSEFIELQNLARQGFERAKRAEELLAQGQRLCAEQEFEKGLEVLKQAHELDELNAAILTALHDALIEGARIQLKTDWRGADALLTNALDLDPESQAGKSVRAQVLAAKRDEEVMQCASQTRRWQTSGELEKAEAELRRGLALYPSDPRLAAILDTLQNEITQANRKKARQREMEIRDEQLKSGSGVDSGAHPILPPTQIAGAQPAGTDPDSPTVADGMQSGGHGEDTVLVPRPRVSPPPVPLASPPPSAAAPAGATDAPTVIVAKTVAAPKALPKKTPVNSRLTLYVAVAAAVLIFVVAAIGVGLWRRSGSGPDTGSVSSQVDLRIRTTPPGAAISVDGKPQGATDGNLTLDAGEHLFEAALPGYEPASQRVSIGEGASPLVELTLRPLPPSVRLVMSGLDAREVWLDEAPGKPEAGSVTIPVTRDGEHVLRLLPAKPMTQEASIGFTTAAGAAPTVVTMAAPELHVVAVSSLAAEARVTSSVTGGVVSVDGVSRGNLTPDGLLVRDLTAGLHELTIGEGNDVKKMGFTVGPVPSLDAVFFSDRDVGSILVVTKENDVVVIVDDKTNVRKTANGQLRLTNMSTQPHTIRVLKDGYVSPAEQSVEVRKGQEMVVRFDLEVVKKPAMLQVRQMMQGVQIFLDDARTPLATVPSAGTLSAEVPPGQHDLRFVADGYVPKTIRREFVAGESVNLTNSDLDLQRPTATLEVETEPTVTVTIRKDNTTIQQFSGSRKLPLGEGNYVVDGRSSDGRATSAEVKLGAGRAETVRLTFKADRGMNGFDQKLWIQADSWYRRTNNNPRFALFDAAPPGTFSFTFTPPGRGFAGIGGGHVRWVAAFKNDRNYVLIDLDNNELARSVVIDGKRSELPKIPHKIPWGNDPINITISVTADKLVHFSKVGNADWVQFDSWDRNDPALAKFGKLSSFIDGKFGFDGDIQMTNFTLRPH